jgi:hypothetical protein
LPSVDAPVGIETVADVAPPAGGAGAGAGAGWGVGEGAVEGDDELLPQAVASTRTAETKARRDKNI